MSRFLLRTFPVILLLALSSQTWAQSSVLGNAALTTTDGYFKDAVYDSARGLVYATSSGSNPNGYLKTIDPLTGDVVDSIFVGDSANRLMISDDNSLVYIGFESSDLGAFRTFDPATRALGSFTGSGRCVDFAINPTNPNSVIVTSHPFDASFTKVDVYLDGNFQSRLPGLPPYFYLDFVSTNKVFAQSYFADGAALLEFDGTRLTTLHIQDGITDGGSPSPVENQQVVFSSGNLIDVLTLQILGNYDTGLGTSRTSVLSLEDLGLTLIATQGSNVFPFHIYGDFTLSIFDSDSFTLLDSIEFRDVLTPTFLFDGYQGHRKLFRIGEDRLCIVEKDRELIIISFTSAPEIILGDCNIDGEVNFLDIAPFIENGLLASSTYLAQADCNEDGEVTFLDIAALIAILSEN